MGTGRCAWLVGAVGAVAIIIVDLRFGYADLGVGYTCEGLGVFVKLDDCAMPSVDRRMARNVLSPGVEC